MTSKTRLTVLLVSTPIIVLVLLGGFLNRVLAGQDTYQPLRVFQEVVGLVVNNYVEPVNNDRIMQGALQGLAEGLDADSAWLNPAQAATVGRAPAAAGRGTVGVELTRQYYLRVIAARDGSPAAKAGLATGDYIRAIDGTPTREMSVWAGRQALAGAPGSKVTLTVLRGNTAEPHDVTLVREDPPTATVSGRILRPGVGLIRVAAFADKTAADLRQQAIALRKEGAGHLIVDLRRTAEGAPQAGFASARLFVASGGPLGGREGRTVPKTLTAAESGDGIITLPVTLLVDNGTSQAAEVFAAALKGNKRATLVGERTLGRAATQDLVKLPDGSALWLTTARFLAPDGAAIHEKGLTPDTAVAEPDVEFGAAPDAADPILDKALELVALAPAA